MTTNLLFASLSYPHLFESWKSVYYRFIHKSNKHFVVETEKNYNQQQPVIGKERNVRLNLKIFQKWFGRIIIQSVIIIDDEILFTIVYNMQNNTNYKLLFAPSGPNVRLSLRRMAFTFSMYINYYKYDCHMPIFLRQKLRNLIDNYQLLLLLLLITMRNWRYVRTLNTLSIVDIGHLSFPWQ